MPLDMISVVNGVVMLPAEPFGYQGRFSSP